MSPKNKTKNKRPQAKYLYSTTEYPTNQLKKMFIKLATQKQNKKQTTHHPSKVSILHNRVPHQPTQKNVHQNCPKNKAKNKQPPPKQSIYTPQNSTKPTQKNVHQTRHPKTKQKTNDPKQSIYTPQIVPQPPTNKEHCQCTTKYPFFTQKIKPILLLSY